MLELLDVEGDMDRLDPPQPVYASALAPGEKLPDVVIVGDAGILVANRCGEEFQEASHRVLAGVGNERRNGRFCAGFGDRSWGLVWDDLAHRFNVT
jgi:hypothetical protein